MNTAGLILSALAEVLSDPARLLYTLAGTAIGIVFGALPGLTATMGVAILLPFTFGLDPVTGMSALAGVYVGGIAGGAISAILLNIPGTPSSMMTPLDGFPMARRGQAGKALGWAVTAAFVGGLISWIALALVAPQVARVALAFGPPEYAMLAAFGLTIVAGISGRSLLKGVLAGLIGFALSFPGVDPIDGNFRFTFGHVSLMKGIPIVPALIGLFAIPEILSNLSLRYQAPASSIRTRDFFPSLAELKEAAGNLVRSSLIGVFIGMIPATGGNIAQILAYDQARRWSRHPETFGKGNPQGIVAAESANNGVTGGALIPMLTLGIPGDSVTAVMLGGLMIHGLQPGPNLFREHASFVYGFLVMLLIANIMMAAIQFFGIRAFVQMLRVPTHYLAPLLLLLCMVGSFAVNNSMFDVWLMLGLGLFGFVMTRAGFPVAPMVLGLVLGPILESEMRRSLILSGGSWAIFVQRPVSLAFLLLAVLAIAAPLARPWFNHALARWARSWRTSTR